MLESFVESLCKLVDESIVLFFGLSVVGNRPPELQLSFLKMSSALLLLYLVVFWR